jgi:hypothetical protein
MQYLNLIKYLLASIGLLTIQSNFAQSYDLAAGVRLGKDLGVSIKMRVPPVDKNFTAEFLAQSSFDGKESRLTLMGEQHIPIITRRINLYIGMGLHAGWIEQDIDQEADFASPAGVSFIGGVEINFKRLSISIDYKPAVNIKGGERTFESDSALTLRYIPFKRNDIFTSPRKKRKRQRLKKRRQKAQNRSSSEKKSWQFWIKN